VTTDSTDNPLWIRQRHAVVDRVVRVVEPLLVAEGFELVDLEFQRSGRATVRIFVDVAGRERFADVNAGEVPDVGVTLEQLSHLTRLLSDALDVADPLESRYELEVSSPGVERSLAHRRDFERARGLLVQVRTHDKVEGQQRFKGVLVAVDEQGIQVQEDQKTTAIPVAQLAKARLVYAPAKPERPARKRARS
jgi:ribosome maturation factor RimP